MIAAGPEVAALYVVLVFRLLLEVVLVHFFLLLGILEGSETEGRHVDLCDRLELLVQEVYIPLGKLRCLIVRQPERFYLFRREVVREDARDRLEPELLSSLPSGMPGDDLAAGVDDNRDFESEFLYARRDCVDRCVVLSGIALVRPQILSPFLYEI